MERDVESKVHKLAARAVINVCSKLNKPLSCSLQSPEILPIQVRDVDYVGRVVCVVSDAKLDEGCFESFLGFRRPAGEEVLAQTGDEGLCHSRRWEHEQ